MSADKKELQKTLDTINSQEKAINDSIRNIFENMTLDKLPEYSLVELTKQLKVCHPYMKFIKMSLLSRQNVTTHYLLISNEIVTVALYKSGITNIKPYAVEQLRYKARSKYK